MTDYYFIHILIITGIYIVLSLSLQLSIGYGGLLNLGHIGFYCIGAYSSAVLTLNGYPFLFAFLLAGIISMFFGFLLSLPTNRLKGDYLTLTTLGFCFIVYQIALNWESLTRGSLGLIGIPSPTIFGFHITNNYLYLFFVIMVDILVYLIIKKIVSSDFGRVIQAVRDNELVLRILGKNSFKIKSIVLMTSAFFAGLAGSLYAHYITFIDPSSFMISQLIPILCIVVIGGLASLRGTILATIVLVILPETIKFIGLPSFIMGPIQQIIYALILLLIIIYSPKGFFGKIELK